MNNGITRREFARQFIIAIELLLEWIELKEHSIQKSNNINIEEPSHDSRLLTASEVARKLNISKGAVYQLIKKKIPSVRINRNIRVRQEDLDEFIGQNRELFFSLHQSKHSLTFRGCK